MLIQIIITEIEGKIPSISGLTTNAALTAVENKIPNVSNLVKKSDYNTKINEIQKTVTDCSHDKYITTPEFNKLTAESFAARVAQANLVTKTDFHDKLKNLNKNINSNKIKHVLVENESKNQKHLIQFIFVVKVTLKMMVLKIIQYFRQYIDTLKQLVLMIVIYCHGSLKDCLMKVLSLLLHLINCLILRQILLIA